MKCVDALTNLPVKGVNELTTDTLLYNVHLLHGSL